MSRTSCSGPTVSIEEQRRRKRRRRMFPYDDAGYEDWAFAPFYGPTGGPSGATFPPFQPTLTSAPDGRFSIGRANPGAGGRNMPGVPSGPNAGMGPVHASQDGNGLSSLTENMIQLNQLIRSMPIWNEKPSPRLLEGMDSVIGEAATSYMNELVGRGDISQEEGKMMMSAIDEMMEKCREVLTRRCPWVNRPKDPVRGCFPAVGLGGF